MKRRSCTGRLSGVYKGIYKISEDIADAIKDSDVVIEAVAPEIFARRERGSSAAVALSRERVPLYIPRQVRNAHPAKKELPLPKRWEFLILNQLISLR